ncbi:MAPK regulated corepressor interacting protein 2 [Anopheles nili]|uniref:MAPK regulated corepressor interacting protein 2 n=1 Tax=Anopheles nili TaxID=185578 RepID=UPI00237BE231|nr:MAPK regulated corepressor interacting protein 2 [Anopheles nili]
MDRRQGAMSMSPGTMRRPGGMSSRDMHPQNHAPYQTQQTLPSASASVMMSNGGNGPPPPATVPSSSVMHQVHPLQPNHQQLHQHQIQHSQHDELIRYINEAWHSITNDKSQKAPEFYKSVLEPRLSGFTPFDLEGWWGQRLVHQLNIGSHGHQ